MAKWRIIIGIIILIIGSLNFLGLMLENTPTPENPPTTIPKTWNFDFLLELGVVSVITAIGAVILGWGIRSSHSSRD